MQDRCNSVCIITYCLAECSYYCWLFSCEFETVLMLYCYVCVFREALQFSAYLGGCQWICTRTTLTYTSPKVRQLAGFYLSTPHNYVVCTCGLYIVYIVYIVCIYVYSQCMPTRRCSPNRSNRFSKIGRLELVLSFSVLIDFLHKSYRSKNQNFKLKKATASR